MKQRLLVQLGVIGLATVLTNCGKPGEPAGKAGGAEQTNAGVAQTGSAKQPLSSVAQARPSEPEHRTIVVSAGTSIVIRTTSTLSTKSTQGGETFVSTLEQPLTADGEVIAPKGSEVEGRVVESDPGGRVKGRATITVTLTRLRTDNDRGTVISTNSLVREAKPTRGKDAAKIGIGSGVGAAIGAIAGGGKGAALGAAAGAGAGTGVVLATRGEQAIIPAESVLKFSLKSPLTVTR